MCGEKCVLLININIFILKYIDKLEVRFRYARY